MDRYGHHSSGSGYGNQVRQGSFRNYGARKQQQASYITPNRNQALSISNIPEPPASSIIASQEPSAQKDYPIILQGITGWTANSWTELLQNADMDQIHRLVERSQQQKVYVILYDPSTKQPLQKFKIDKVDALNPENPTTASRPMLTAQLRTFKTILDGFGYTLVEVK
jgi:hypothetical protein